MIPFDSNSSHYSLNNLRALLRASTLAYESGELLKNALKEEFGSRRVWEFKSNHDHLLGKIPLLKIQDTQGFIAADPKKIILAFRGSEGVNRGESFIKDWTTDAVINQATFNKYFPSAPNIGNIHSGFGKGLRDVWTKVAARLEDTRKIYPEASLWITGHSLGGALAVLASACCYYETQNQSPVAGCYTFGQPRVGDLLFRSFYESALGSRTYFVVNRGDLVTRIPPRKIDCMQGLNYATTGRIVFLENGGATNDALAWGRYTQTDPLGWEGMPRLLDGVAEHACESYLNSITQAEATLRGLSW